ncbi:MAG: S41 family peptidase [Bacteroides sp.]|nr:S41 family peptidase [Bacteroides sp.]MCM1379239.1 S41 family peptidase [Bacteroides sp.]MCM1445103.1 S41 family peptidase [Prevotella sp.]
MKIQALILATMIAATASAATPLWLRDIKISPSGDKIAFTYKGDIYTVPTSGGAAIRLTATPDDIESSPIWSPDGKTIAFASSHHGSADIFTVNIDGSGLKRVTSFSSAERPEAFSPDGKLIYFSAAIQDPAASVSFPTARLTELYTIPAEGGAMKQVLATPAVNISFAPDGSYFVYQDVKGMENTWRKHHTSSVTRDIWKYDLKSGKHTPLIMQPGEDLWPVVNESSLLFISERNGASANVYAVALDNTDATPLQLTDFKDHPVRFLSQGADGTLAFGYDGEIYTLANAGNGVKTTPKKVNIEIADADYQSPDFVSFSSGANDAVASPDGKQVAFTHRGDLFVTSVEYNTTKQLSETPQAESSPSWADGGRTLYFVSDREGRNDIYKIAMTRKEDPDMAHATSLKTERVLPAKKGVERSRALTNPDGSKLAFIQNRNELMVMDLTSKKVTKLAGGELNPERDGEMQFSWSPDGNWIVFTCVPHHHSPYYDIALVNADGNTPEISYITETGYFEEMPRFTPDGQAVTWLSERYGMRNQASWGTQYDVMIAYLNRAARDRAALSEEELALFTKKDEKKDSLTVVEREGLQDRIKRLTPYSSSLADAVVSPDGSTLYYLSKVEKGYDLWKKDLRKADISLVNKLGAGPAEFQVVGKDLFILSPSTMKKMAFSGEKLKNISYSGRQKIDRAAERDYMLEYVRTEEGERFYTPTMHGVKWDALVDHYRKFLPHINNNASFSEMLSEILGELNVSHTGSGYRPHSGADESTANLGLIYDLTYGGDGWKVAEVVANGPFDRADAIVAPGDIITHINGVNIDRNTDFTSLLNGLTGKATLVKVNNDREQVVKPISSGAMNSLLYDRWVKRNAATVDSLSNGRLGYVHIKSMADPSFRTMYADVLGKYNDREGIVIDTRWNGGGRMHEDIEVLFSGEQYLTQKVRGEKTATMPSRRWNKPSIMLICEANYSNAHGTPWVYKHRGLGKLVGMPVPGTMTSVNWVDLQDDTMYFGIPVIGYELPNGTYLENTQLEPDIKVANSPEAVAAGRDDQLRVAVETLLGDIDAAK